MDIASLHPIQLKALIDGHRDGLFREYKVHIKPLKQCLGLKPLTVGELLPRTSSLDEHTSDGAEAELREKGRVAAAAVVVDEDQEGQLNIESCFMMRCGAFGREKLEADRVVVEWLAEIVHPSCGAGGVSGLVEIMEPPRDGVWEKGREEIPVLRWPRGDEEEPLELMHGGTPTLNYSHPRLPPIDISPSMLANMKLPFRRSKPEKDADGNDGGLRWSKKVKRDIAAWAAVAGRGEKLSMEGQVAEFLKEVMKGGSVVAVDGQKEGACKVVEVLQAEDIQEDRIDDVEILFPLEFGGMVEAKAKEEEWTGAVWPPPGEAVRIMQGVGHENGEGDELTLLGEFKGGYATENLSSALQEEKQDASTCTPKTASLHIPSSPPIHHLPVVQGEMPLTPSPSTKRPRECPIGYEDLYIEGPLTPLPSSPYPFHHNLPGAHKPPPPFVISLPPVDRGPSQEGNEESLPTPIATDGRAFIAALMQEQLSADDGQLRELVPIMDAGPGEEEEELRLNAPWDGINILYSSRARGVDRFESDTKKRRRWEKSWLGAAGEAWLGVNIIALELAWRPVVGKTYAADILREEIADGNEKGEEMLEEVERGVDAGVRAEEGLVPVINEQVGWVGEQEEEEEDLEMIIARRNGGEKCDTRGPLGKRKREIREDEMNVRAEEAQGNHPLNSDYARPLPSTSNSSEKKNRTEISLLSPSQSTELGSGSGALELAPAGTVPPHEYPPAQENAITAGLPDSFGPIFTPLTTSFSPSAAVSTFMLLRNRTIPIALRNKTITHPPPPIVQPAPPQPPPVPAERTLTPPIPQNIPTPTLPPILPKATFVISTALFQSHRGVLRILKNIWQRKAEWVERDYPPIPMPSCSISSTGGGTRASVVTQVKGVNPIDCSDCEQPPLLVSPTSGIVFSSLHRIRQRVLLPGEKALPGSGGGMKDSLRRMSMTVDRLWVLVLASGVTVAYSGDYLSPRDLETWWGFTAFCASLEEGSVRPVLIFPGVGGDADGPFAHWAAAVMAGEAIKWNQAVKDFAPWWQGEADGEGEGEGEDHVSHDSPSAPSAPSVRGDLPLQHNMNPPIRSVIMSVLTLT